MPDALSVLQQILSMHWKVLQTLSPSRNKSSAVNSCWDKRPFGHNRHELKSGGGAAVPLSVGELGPHLTQCHLGRDKSL